MFMASLNGKHIFGMVKVGEKGQIVIPKDARKVFGIKPGDQLMLAGDETQGLAIITNDLITKAFGEILNKEKTKPEVSE